MTYERRRDARLPLSALIHTECASSFASVYVAGNKRFRDLITSSLTEYNKSESRLEKSLVVHSIVESIRTAGGRFLKSDQATGRWRGKYSSFLTNMVQLISG